MPVTFNDELPKLIGDRDGVFVLSAIQKHKDALFAQYVVGASQKIGAFDGALPDQLATLPVGRDLRTLCIYVRVIRRPIEVPEEARHAVLYTTARRTHALHIQQLLVADIKALQQRVDSLEKEKNMWRLEKTRQHRPPMPSKLTHQRWIRQKC